MNFSTSKKVFTFISTLSVFFSLSSISCTKRIKPNDNEIIFDTIQVNKTQSIDYKKSKLNCNLHIAFTYPIAYKKISQLSDLQKLFIKKVFPPQYANLSPQDAVKNFSEQYIRDFQSIPSNGFFNEDDTPEDESDFIDENDSIYELNLENEVLYNHNNILSFVVRNINYEGGAQGSNSIYGYVIDLNTGNFLTEEDFAGNNYKKNLSSIIVQKIATAKGLSDVSQLESVGYNAIEDIAPNENFTIDNKGITYYFNESEIAAYFIGITKVFIPYEELKAYITDDSPISSLTGL